MPFSFSSCKREISKNQKTDNIVSIITEDENEAENRIIFDEIKELYNIEDEINDPVRFAENNNKITELLLSLLKNEKNYNINIPIDFISRTFSAYEGFPIKVYYWYSGENYFGRFNSIIQYKTASGGVEAVKTADLFNSQASTLDYFGIIENIEENIYLLSGTLWRPRWYVDLTYFICVKLDENGIELYNAFNGDSHLWFFQKTSIMMGEKTNTKINDHVVWSQERPFRIKFHLFEIENDEVNLEAGTIELIYDTGVFKGDYGRLYQIRGNLDEND
jgi:hypothetical protein